MTGASGKLESAITGNLAGLACSVYNRSGCALVTGCKTIHAYRNAQLQRHMHIYANICTIMTTGHTSCTYSMHVAAAQAADAL